MSEIFDSLRRKFITIITEGNKSASMIFETTFENNPSIIYPDVEIYAQILS